ncbi:MAG: methyltransferase domain-containing protein [Pyrinomonadaceae bacterium]
MIKPPLKKPTPEAIPSKYIHGTEPREQQRLSLLNRILNRASLSEMNLTGGEKILDVGSGLGQFTRLLARTAGKKGRVIGIERDLRQLAEAERQALSDGEEDLVEFRQGDALDLPLADDEWENFDVAHARFVLEHIADPLAVVREMVRAVRPGGRIILEDDNHDSMRLYPDLPEFEALWRAYMRSFEVLGNDPLIGHKLVALLHQAGARPIRNTWIFFGSCAGEKNFGHYIENLLGVIETARKTIIEEKLLTEKEYRDKIAAVENWSRRPDAAIWFSLSWAEGGKIL